MAVSPTQRSLAHLREQGYTCEVVERWNSHTRTRHDLFNFIDIIAIKRDETLAVQTTVTDSMASRATKIADSPLVGAVREAGWRIVVHGWAKRGTPSRWTLKELDLS